MTKILTPQQLAPVMEIARELLPPGMELAYDGLVVTL